MQPSQPDPVSRPALAAFQPILALIKDSRRQALQAVNVALVDLHWRIGEYLSVRIREHGWGQGTVNDLANWLNLREPDLRGFSASNLWRMRQFFESYRHDPKLAALTRELTWTHNILIFNKCRTPQERGFYLRLAIRERWGSRELERQINGCLFERTLTGTPKLSPALRELHPGAGAPGPALLLP